MWLYEPPLFLGRALKSSSPTQHTSRCHKSLDLGLPVPFGVFKAGVTHISQSQETLKWISGTFEVSAAPTTSVVLHCPPEETPWQTHNPGMTGGARRVRGRSLPCHYGPSTSHTFKHRSGSQWPPAARNTWYLVLDQLSPVTSKLHLLQLSLSDKY